VFANLGIPAGEEGRRPLCQVSSVSGERLSIVGGSLSIRYTDSILRGQMVGPKAMKEDMRMKDREQLV